MGSTNHSSNESNEQDSFISLLVEDARTDTITPLDTQVLKEQDIYEVVIVCREYGN